VIEHASLSCMFPPPVRKLMRVSFILFVLGLWSCAPAASDAVGNTAILLIKNVSIVDTKQGRVVSDQSVVVKGNRISAVGSSNEIDEPPGARTVDGSGKYLIPGLWDMHVHTSSDKVSRDAILPLFIANGVTGVRSMAADCIAENGGCGEPVTTIDQVRVWQAEIAAESLIGPRVVASSYYTNGPESEAESTIYNPATAEHGRAYARLLKDRGVDLIKVYSGMYRDAYFAMADEANTLGLPIAGHVPLAVRASEASGAGQQSIEHITGFLEECSTEETSLRSQIMTAYSKPSEFWGLLIRMTETFSEERCAALYSQLVQNGTWHVPTLNVDAFSDQLESPRRDWQDDERMRYVPREEAELWDQLERTYFAGITDYKTALQPHFHKSFEITSATYAAGVPILAGSDSGEYGIIWGFSLHRELELLVEAGLTDADALRAATINPAVFLDMTTSLGTIEEGKLADLVLLNANPLDDISNTQTISAVIADGRLFDREGLDKLLEQIESAVSK